MYLVYNTCSNYKGWRKNWSKIKIGVCLNPPEYFVTFVDDHTRHVGLYSKAQRWSTSAVPRVESPGGEVERKKDQDSLVWQWSRVYLYWIYLIPDQGRHQTRADNTSYSTTKWGCWEAESYTNRGCTYHVGWFKASSQILGRGPLDGCISPKSQSNQSTRRSHPLWSMERQMEAPFACSDAVPMHMCLKLLNQPTWCAHPQLVYDSASQQPHFVVEYEVLSARVWCLPLSGTR